MMPAYKFTQCLGSQSLYNSTCLPLHSKDASISKNYKKTTKAEILILTGLFPCADVGPESKILGTKKPQNTLIFCGLS